MTNFQETEKVLKVQGQSNKKVSDLELAVGRMKQHQELLQQRLKDEADRKLKLEVGQSKILHLIKMIFNTLFFSFFSISLPVSYMYQFESVFYKK